MEAKKIEEIKAEEKYHRDLGREDLANMPSGLLEALEEAEKRLYTSPKCADLTAQLQAEQEKVKGLERKQKALFETIAAGLKTQDKFQEQAGGRGQKIIRMEAEEEKLLKVMKMAYRKHHLQDISIGSDELSDELLDAICRLVGEGGYQDWLNELDAEKENQV